MEPRVGWLQGDQNGTVWVRGVQALMIDIDARLLPFNLCFEALRRCSLYGKSLQDVSSSGSLLAGRRRDVQRHMASVESNEGAWQSQLNSNLSASKANSACERPQSQVISHIFRPPKLGRYTDRE